MEKDFQMFLGQIDYDLLEEQRNHLLALMDYKEDDVIIVTDYLDGIVGLLDYILDFRVDPDRLVNVCMIGTDHNNEPEVVTIVIKLKESQLRKNYHREAALNYAKVHTGLRGDVIVIDEFDRLWESLKCYDWVDWGLRYVFDIRDF